LKEEGFDSLDDAGRKLALWRYDYNRIRPDASLGNQDPKEERRALFQFQSTPHDALAQSEAEESETQPRKHS